MKDALALALVHFLWQGAVLGALGWGLMRLGRSASVRYTVGVGTLAAMLAAPIVTFAVVAKQTSLIAAPPVSVVDAARVPGPATIAATSGASSLPALPTTWILAAWLAGVCGLSVRLTGGWLVARRLAATGVSPVSPELERAAVILANRVGLRRAVRILTSTRAAVPMMIGWWRPVVLIPVATLSGMSLEQIEAVLAHEFAHIRRHDYLVNFLQTCVETVCFYHPAVWFLSREVRRERELCCDDIAVAVCDRVTYVTALARVAEIASPRLALAASGGSLRDRIHRLMTHEASTGVAGSGWPALVLALLIASMAASHTLDATVPEPAMHAKGEERLAGQTPSQDVTTPRAKAPARRPATPKDTVKDLRRLLAADRATYNALHANLLTLQKSAAKGAALPLTPGVLDPARPLTAQEVAERSARRRVSLNKAIADLRQTLAVISARITQYEQRIQQMSGSSQEQQR